jgi:hypothetical protein
MTKTTYKVTGPTAYKGHQPGEQFEAELTDEQEQRALERGAIEVVRTTKKKGADDA